MLSLIKIAFLKIGNIGSSPLLDLLLDERADREDIDVRVFSSGAKIPPKGAPDLLKMVVEHSPDLLLITTPNASLSTPKQLAADLEGKEFPVIFVTDKPGENAIPELEKHGHGYIIVEADCMLGARREFLDPTEMAYFNAHLVGVLSATGVFAFLTAEMDKVVASLKAGEKPTLPRVVVDAEKATEGFFKNPYARSKAIAALDISARVAKITTRACFVEKKRDKYIMLCSVGHEMLRTAFLLAMEARELEKAGDTVRRQPHFADGELGDKWSLLEKPSRSS